MTDPHLDELASAHLDGATTPEEAARIDADPALRARVEELRRVRDAVAAAPAAPDPVRRDAAIAAALAAFDAPDEPAAPSAVTPLRAPSARRGTSPLVPRVLGVAAAIVVLALLVPVLTRLGESNDDDTAFDSTGAAVDAPSEALDAAEDAGSATSAPTGADLDLDLGAFADLDQLVTAVAAADLQTLTDRSSPTSGNEDFGALEPAACVPATAETEAAARVERATATVGDDAVIVVLRERAGGTRHLVVYRAADCQVLADAQL